MTLGRSRLTEYIENYTEKIALPCFYARQQTLVSAYVFRVYLLLITSEHKIDANQARLLFQRKVKYGCIQQRSSRLARETTPSLACTIAFFWYFTGYYRLFCMGNMAKNKSQKQDSRGARPLRGIQGGPLAQF